MWLECFDCIYVYLEINSKLKVLKMMSISYNAHSHHRIDYYVPNLSVRCKMLEVALLMSEGLITLKLVVK
jgi:hypothetical protein